MTGDVIKSFLVGLGFDVDDASLAAFNKGIATASDRVAKLYASVQVATAGIVYGISEISQGFEQMGYEYRIIAPAINKAIVLRNELLKAYQAAGINITKTIVASVKLNMSLTKTKFALEAIYKSVGSKFFALLTKQSDLFRQKIYANMPKIQNALEHFVKFVFKAFEATAILGERVWSILQRVYEFFVALDKKTSGWSTIILGVIAAWEALNLAFLLSPIGALLALGVAILALWDDFETFREGGQSLINWGSDFIKTLTGLVAAIAAVALAFGAWKVIEGVIVLVQALNAALTATNVLAVILEAPFWAIVAVIGALTAALTLADEKWKIFGGHLSGFFSTFGGKVLDFVGGGGSNAAANIQNNPINRPLVNPIGTSSVANSQTNQNVNQQTNINVLGTADAQSTARAVAGQQSRTNYDLVTNLKGSTR